MPTTKTDAHGQPLERRFNAGQNFAKSMESLIGIVRGILADSVLNEGEVLFLDTWLMDNHELTTCWPGDVIASRVRRVIADGVVTKDELDDLQLVLSQLIGGQVGESGSTSGEATRLPVDPCIELAFKGKTYCFTGKFIGGTRNNCQQQIIDRGGEALDRVTWKLNYLVIGGLASRDWAHTSYGRKIEEAVEYRRKGAPILILAEERWQQLLPPIGIQIEL